MIICDFCSASNPTKKIDCVPFIMSETAFMVHWSDNAWAACATCAKLVYEDKWSELIERVIVTAHFATPDFETKQRYREYLAEVYRKFRIAKGQTA